MDLPVTYLTAIEAKQHRQAFEKLDASVQNDENKATSSYNLDLPNVKMTSEVIPVLN